MAKITFDGMAGVPTNRADAYAFAVKAEHAAARLKALVREDQKVIDFEKSKMGLALLTHKDNKKLMAEVAKANEATLIKFKSERLKQTESARYDLLKELNGMRERAAMSRSFITSPKQVLQVHKLGSDERAQIVSEIRGLGKAGLATLAQRAVATNDRTLAGAIISVVDQLPRDERPDFSTQEMAEAICGAECKATADYLLIADKAFKEAIEANRELEGQKLSATDKISHALAFRHLQPADKVEEGKANTE